MGSIKSWIFGIGGITIILALIGVFFAVRNHMNEFARVKTEGETYRQDAAHYKDAYENEKKFNQLGMALQGIARLQGDIAEQKLVQGTVVIRELQNNVRQVQTSRPEDDGPVAPVLRDTITGLYPLSEAQTNPGGDQAKVRCPDTRPAAENVPGVAGATIVPGTTVNCEPLPTQREGSVP